MHLITILVKDNNFNKYNMEFICEIENNLSPEMCKKIIKVFENDDRKRPGRISGGVNKNIKKSTDLLISHYKNEGWGEIDNYLHERLGEGLKKYTEYIKEKLKIKAINLSPLLNVFENMSDSGYQIQKTSKNEYFTWHHDCKHATGRNITFVWYLNTLNPDLDGGTTDFECGKSIVPEVGKLVLFPATWTYIHQGAPVISDNSKYICTGWVS